LGTATKGLITNLEVISLAGLLLGVLAHAATSTLVRTQTIAIERLLQTITRAVHSASPPSREKETAALGLFFHFFTAFNAASIY
jgi:hypothetical protein